MEEDDKKKKLDEAISTFARLMLFVADELEPLDEPTLAADLETVYRCLVSIERCARLWTRARRQN